MKSKERIFLPSLNTGSNVFVFGSNLLGIHGAGAAKEAVKHWGALRGQAEGRQGMAYAIPTKAHWTDEEGMALGAINRHVENFLTYAKEYPELTFLVTRIGCGFAGHRDKDIAPMFSHASTNCVLPEGWW